METTSTVAINLERYGELLIAEHTLSVLKGMFEKEHFPLDSNIRAFTGWKVKTEEVDLPDISKGVEDAS